MCSNVDTGDKSNHVATLHLAQLLYIWPFFVFFSAPLFIPLVLFKANSIYRTWKPSQRESYPYLDSAMSRIRRARRYEARGAAICALVVALAIIRFNTIIHPFTLADNRHYMFYVFRYTILRAWWIRYALAPVYVLCAWLCWTALRGYSLNTRDREWIRTLFAASSPPPSRDCSKSSATTSSTPSASASATAEADGGGGQPYPPPPLRAVLSTTTPPRTSTALLLLLATALSLVTAPLVEPRYFILPWVFWRLHVPAWPIRRQQHTNVSGSRILREPRLVLELAWFALVNLGTMYVFLAYPFYWKSAEADDGTVQLLDGGRVQRFMW